MLEKDVQFAFISHRSIDAKIADMLVDFLVGVGISKENIFCSSLPGNDIGEKISGEVKNAIVNSKVNILILSEGQLKMEFGYSLMKLLKRKYIMIIFLFILTNKLDTVVCMVLIQQII